MPRSPLSRSAFFFTMLGLLGACADPGAGDLLDTAGEVPRVDDLVLHSAVDAQAPTAILVHWTSPEPGDAWVEYHVLGEEPLETPATVDAAGQTSALLVGLPASEDVCFTAYVRSETAIHTGFGCARTLSWSQDVPSLVVTEAGADDRPEGGYILIPVTGPASGVAVVDRRGRLVWFWPVDSSAHPMAARVHPDGGAVMLKTHIPWTETQGGIQRLWVDLPPEEVAAPGGHHAMEVLRDGSIAFLGGDVRPWTYDDGATADVAGDTIMIAHPDGSLEQLFTTWDWGTPEDHGSGDSFYNGAQNWTHANSLSLHPSRDTLLVGLRDYPVLLEVSLDDGRVVAEYGEGGDIPLAAGSAGFTWVHDARWTGTHSILLTSTADETVAIEYDTRSGVMVETWTYGAGRGVKANVHGTALPLPGGSVLMGYGDLSWVQEVDRETGKLLWDLRLENGYNVKNLEFIEDLSDLVAMVAGGR